MLPAIFGRGTGKPGRQPAGFRASSRIAPRARAFAGALIGEVRGVAFVETALIAPFLAMAIMGTVDTARYAAAKMAIQQAVNRGLEMSMMGGPTTAASDIQSQAAAQAGVATSAVTVTQTLECSGTSTSWSSTCTSAQETARYTQIQISTTFTPSFALGMLAKTLGNANGVVPISATGVLRIQ
ncbi:MAG TPA: TadE/TadG family type IV pilus assembly protein [Sphingobium sp.]|nr:TadE/TadG family type IV pilus assembly protein [Sphingobium sp.]